MKVPKATVARRAYNRALKDLDRELNFAIDAARSISALTGTTADPRVSAWVRGVEFVINRARRNKL